MVESLVWSPESIMDLSKDTLIDTETTGAVTLSDSVLELNGEARAVFSYTYDTAENILETSDLQLVLDVINSDTTINSRYDESVQVELYMQYYKEELDSSGSVTGYVLGHTETYQINPYFKHEIEGYTNTYEISVDKNRVVYIEVHFINVSENIVKFVNPKIYNSMKVLDAINEYGGGSGGDEPAPPQFNDLVLYSLEEVYTIDKMDGSLRLRVYIPDEYVNKYKYDYYGEWRINVTYSNINLSGDVLFSTSDSNIAQEFTLEDGTKSTVNILGGQRIISSYGGNGARKVRVELSSNTSVYAERDIKITNNNVNDMQLIIDSTSGKIDGNEVLSGRVKILPENLRSGPGGAFDDVTMTLTSYDGGDATITSGGGDLNGGVIPFTIIGRTNGKVKLTVTTNALSTYSYQRLFPSGFTKEFIVDVINVTGHVFVDTPDGTILDNTKEYIDLILTTNYGTGMKLNSFSVQSLDGNGKAAASKIINEDYKAGLRIYALDIGKVKVSGYISNRWVGMSFNDYFEQEIDITGLELTTEITTNTGLFEITQGAGQLEVYPRPNYGWHGGFSFSQASIDGGSVTISDKGDYALITGNKDGKLNLICTPVNGPAVQCEISVSGQYPEDVKLTCADNIFKVAIGGNITIYAEPGNVPNSNHNRYVWLIDKLSSDSGVSKRDYNTYTVLTGTGLGKVRLNCLRYVDNKFMNSVIVKVVQSLDSDKTVLTYPNTQQYWVVYRRTDQSNRLWLATMDSTGILDKLIKTSAGRLYTDNVTLGAYTQYRIESGQWYKYGNWTGDTNPCDSVGQLYASNLDIYDEEGNLLVAKTDNYDDVDFDAIIYGQDVYILSTSEDEETETTE